jgi:hypothetical protein
MATKFLITGLPRSRTAWMAAFMGCQHEPSGQMNSLFDINEFYKVNDGCSDSTMGWWLPWILKTVRPRVVIIDRPIAEVEASLQREFPEIEPNLYCKKLLASLDRWRRYAAVMSVPYASLDNVATMRKVFWHLRPGTPFDEGRYFHMQRQKIVVDKNKLQLTGKLLPAYFSQKELTHE